MIELTVLTPEEYTAWDEFVVDNQGSFYQLSSIPKLISSRNGEIDFKIIGIKRNDELYGGFILYEYFKGPFKVATTKFSGIPYTGILLKKDNARRHYEAVSKVAYFDLFDKYTYVSLSNPPNFNEVRPFIFSKLWNVKTRFTHQVDLGKFKLVDLNKKVRWAYNYATRLGFSSKRLELNRSIAKTYSLIHKGKKSDVSKLYSLDIFKGLPVRAFVTSVNGELVALEIFLIEEWNSKAYRWFAGCLDAYKSKGVPTKLLIDSLLYLKKENIKLVDLMGGNIPNLVNFTLQFNPNVVTYFEVTKNLFSFPKF